jgi:hypothetical protein
MFDAIVANIATWETEDRAMARRYNLPNNSVDTLNSFHSDICTWAHELATGGWPLSLDHVDCHANNAFVQPDGPLILYDWDEAILSCPFFSLDRLLDSASNLDKKHQPEQINPENASFSTEHLVRQMYVNTRSYILSSYSSKTSDMVYYSDPIKIVFPSLSRSNA